MGRFRLFFKILGIPILIVGLIWACNSEDPNTPSLELNSIINTSIAVENANDIELSFEASKVLDVFNKFSEKYDLGIRSTALEIIEVDKEKYLRFYGEENMVSTIALIKEPNGSYRSGETVCTTVNCASGGGCIPSGSYCTECRPHGPSGPLGDCKRTTSNND